MRNNEISRLQIDGGWPKGSLMLILLMNNPDESQKRRREEQSLSIKTEIPVEEGKKKERGEIKSGLVTEQAEPR